MTRTQIKELAYPDNNNNKGHVNWGQLAVLFSEVENVLSPYRSTSLLEI